MSLDYAPDFALHHGGIYVKDLENSIRWYEDVLNYECVSRATIPTPGGEINVAFIRRGDSFIELFHKPEARPFDAAENNSRIGTNHLCLSVKLEDFKPFEEYLRRKGVEITLVAHHPEEVCHNKGGGWCMFISDPDGTQLEIIEDVRFNG